MKYSFILFAVSLIGLLPNKGHAAPQLVTVSNAAARGLTAELLANIVADDGSQFTVDGTSATFDIANSIITNAETDPRAVGVFANGNVASGTSLDDPVDPNAVFAGGIGIDMGVCLCTGFLSDNEPTRPTGFPMQVGVEGANNGLPIDVPNF